MSSLKQHKYIEQASFLIPARTDRAELLDMGVGTDADVQANFADLWRINRYLGGIQAITSHMYPRLMAAAAPTTVVDIGTGSGDIAAVIRKWAEARQVEVRVWGLDLSARNLLLTRRDSGERYETRLQADAMHLPFLDGSVDYFISSLFMHHLSPDALGVLLAKTFQSAKKGIIMSDLTRGRLPVLAFKMGQPIFARNFLTRHDGVASIRRAYTPSELVQIARAAGLLNVRVHRHLGWRMTLVAEK